MIEYATQILRIQHKDKLLDITIQMFTWQGSSGQMLVDRLLGQILLGWVKFVRKL